MLWSDLGNFSLESLFFLFFFNVTLKSSGRPTPPTHLYGVPLVQVAAVASNTSTVLPFIRSLSCSCPWPLKDECLHLISHQQWVINSVTVCHFIDRTSNCYFSWSVTVGFFLDHLSVQDSGALCLICRQSQRIGWFKKAIWTNCNCATFVHSNFCLDVDL